MLPGGAARRSPRACGRSCRGRRRRGSARGAAGRRRRSPPRRGRGRRRPGRRSREPAGPRPCRRPSPSADADAEATEDVDEAVAVGGIGGGRPDAGLADLRLERGRRSLGDDLAAVDDPDPVGEAIGLLQVLGRQEDGHPLVVGEALDLLPEGAAALRVEAGRRLVEEEDPRAVDEREREIEAALHAARIAADLAIGRLGEADPLDQLVARGRVARPWARPGAPSAAACARGP